MTREELRDYVEEQRNLDIIPYHVYSTLIDGIDTLEQEPCENWHDVPCAEMTLEQARQAVKDLRKKLAECLEQEPRKGRWIRVDKDKLRCSKCDVIHFIAQYPQGKIAWCPNCGSRNEVEE